MYIYIYLERERSNNNNIHNIVLCEYNIHNTYIYNTNNILRARRQPVRVGALHGGGRGDAYDYRNVTETLPKHFDINWLTHFGGLGKLLYILNDIEVSTVGCGRMGSNTSIDIDIDIDIAIDIDCIYAYIHMYIHTYICIYIYIPRCTSLYIYIYIERERDR